MATQRISARQPSGEVMVLEVTPETTGKDTQAADQGETALGRAHAQHYKSKCRDHCRRQPLAWPMMQRYGQLELLTHVETAGYC